MSIAKKSLNVNGKRVSITHDDPQMPLFYALRGRRTAPPDFFGVTRWQIKQY
jgi:hypothetical protein